MLASDENDCSKSRTCLKLWFAITAKHQLLGSSEAEILDLPIEPPVCLELKQDQVTMEVEGVASQLC